MKRVVHHQEESIGERYTSLKRQAHRYDQEVRALQFFHLDQDVDLACKVLAIADWAEEYNQLSTHPIPSDPGCSAGPVLRFPANPGSIPFAAAR